MPIAPPPPCRFPGCPSLGVCPIHHDRRDRREQDRERSDRQPWRKWYDLKRWKLLARAVLDADPLCVMCRALGSYEAATVVDHRIPHRGAPALFWSRANLQGLCARHHNQKTGRGE